MTQRGFLIEIATGDIIKATIHDTAIDRVEYPADEFEFIPDDDSDPRVAVLRDKRDEPPPPGPPPIIDDLLILAHKNSTTQEKTDAQLRIDARPVP